MTKIVNVKITSTFLGIEDRGLLSSFLYLEWEGGVQGFGGYHLIGPYCALWVKRVLETVGVKDWDKLPGKYIRIEEGKYGSSIDSIGHIIEDKWFNVREEMKEMEDAAQCSRNNPS